MRLLRHLRYALRSAWAGLLRNAAVNLAATTSIALILAVVAIGALLGHTFSSILDGYKDRVSVIGISIADGTPQPVVDQFVAELRADPRVASVRYVSKEEELARFKADPTNVAFTQGLEEVGNPLAAKIEVKAADIRYLGEIDQIARAWPAVDRTEPTDYQGEFIRRMINFSNIVTGFGLALFGALGVISVVIVMNTVRTAVFHRRKEIEVMKLVGATEWFVKFPFVVEGMVVGAIAAVTSMGLLVAFYRPFVRRFQADFFFIPLAYDPGFLNLLARDMLFAGILLGAVGSYLGVRRYVRL